MSNKEKCAHLKKYSITALEKEVLFKGISIRLSLLSRISESFTAGREMQSTLADPSFHNNENITVT